MPTENERGLKEHLESLGYTVYRNGWPDFLAVRGNDVLAIEHKSDRNQRLSPIQKHNDNRELTYKEIGEIFDVSRQRVHQVLSKYRAI